MELTEKFIKIKEEIFKQLFKSDEISEFLAKEDIVLDDIIFTIAKAPVSLFKKRDLIDKLITYKKEAGTFCENKFKNYTDFNNYYNNNREDISKENEIENALLTIYSNTLKEAINELMTCDAPFFLTQWTDGDYPDLSDFSVPVEGYEMARCIVAHNYTIEKTKDESYIDDKWQELEKYCYNKKENCYNQTYKFIMINGEVMFFSKLCKEKNKIDIQLFNTDSGLNLPLPFKTGDILRTDTLPVSSINELNYNMLIYIEDNYALKFSDVFYELKDFTKSLKKTALYNACNGCTKRSLYSPIYNLERYDLTCDEYEKYFNNSYAKRWYSREENYNETVKNVKKYPVILKNLSDYLKENGYSQDFEKNFTEKLEKYVQSKNKTD